GRNPAAIEKAIVEGFEAQVGRRLTASERSQLTEALRDFLPEAEARLAAVKERFPNAEATMMANNAPQGGANAGARLPNLQGMSRVEAHIAIRNQGFEYHGTTRGGYVRYRHADGSEIWIRPNGEVMRYGPRVEGRPGHPRLDRFGNPADHPADEFVPP